MMDYWIIAQLPTLLQASEGSGDSETGLEFADDHGLLRMQQRPADDDDDDDHDDDAESCSHDSYSRARIEHVSDDGGESDGSGDGDDDDEAHEVDEEGVFVWLPANARTKVKEEKEVKVVDSEEDDRLFWETCLATGF